MSQEKMQIPNYAKIYYFVVNNCDKLLIVDVETAFYFIMN